MIDVILGGAPKCGTSTLYYWLAQHPGVHAAEPKEPRVLMDRNLGGTDFDQYMVRAREQYDKIFGPYDGRLRLEGTTQYLYQQLPLQVLPTLPSSPRVIFLLRDPARRILSSFQYSKYNLGRVGKQYDFATYCQDLLAGRQENIERNVSHTHTVHFLADQLDRSSYYIYLKAYLDQLGSDQILVLYTRELRETPQAVWDSVLKFLKLPSTPLPTISNANLTYQPKSFMLNKIIKGVAPHLRGLRKNWLIRKMYSYTKKTAPPALSDQDVLALSQLEEYFEQRGAAFRSVGISPERW